MFNAITYTIWGFNKHLVSAFLCGWHCAEFNSHKSEQDSPYSEVGGGQGGRCTGREACSSWNGGQQRAWGLRWLLSIQSWGYRCTPVKLSIQKAKARGSQTQAQPGQYSIITRPCLKTNIQSGSVCPYSGPGFSPQEHKKNKTRNTMKVMLA